MTKQFMKVSKSWLKELVDLKISEDELLRLIPLRTIGIKEVTSDFIELDMKGYNRADLLSLRGVAYEIAAITDTSVKFSEISDNDYIWVGKDLEKTQVSIEDKELSPLQIVAKIEGLKFTESSPEWIKKLNDCGMRSVNNIADVTNLVMLEYGHPLHAFDASVIKDETINVRRAIKGELVKTLDGISRELTPDDIVLSDSEKPLDVAGVMGSKDTEVKQSTTTILLSASLFNPKTIRKTSQRLKLSSEASKRFFHGLTKRRALQALNAAIRLYSDLGGKLTAINIVGETVDTDKEVNISLDKINALIGLDLDEKLIEDALNKLNFKVSRLGSGSWKVMPPYFRLDIEIEEDVIEEIARLYGYEKIPAKKLEGALPVKIDQSQFELIYKIKTGLVELGLTEVQTYSFFSTNVLRNLGLVESLDKLIKVANPMSAETQYLRPIIWPNLMEVIANNKRAGFEDIAIFEVGKVYLLNSEGEINENYVLSIALMNGSDNPLEELYAIWGEIKNKLKIDVAEKKNGPDIGLFHPNRVVSIQNGGLCEVHQRIADKFGVSLRVAVLETDLRELL